MDITDETQKSRQKRKDTQLISTLRHFSQIRNGSVLRKARGCPSAATDDSWKIRNWIPDREEFVSLSLSDSYSRGGGAERKKKRGVWLLFLRNVCSLSSKKKKRREERRTVEFLQISDHDSHYSYSFLSHKLQSSPSIIPEVQIFV